MVGEGESEVGGERAGRPPQRRPSPAAQRPGPSSSSDRAAKNDRLCLPPPPACRSLSRLFQQLLLYMIQQPPDSAWTSLPAECRPVSRPRSPDHDWPRSLRSPKTVCVLAIGGHVSKKLRGNWLSTAMFGSCAKLKIPLLTVEGSEKVNAGFAKLK